MLEESILNNKIQNGKYYSNDGKIISEILNGNGIYTDHYLTGTTRCIAGYKNGVNEGMIKWFYPNGSLENYVEIKNGKVLKNETYKEKI